MISFLRRSPKVLQKFSLSNKPLYFSVSQKVQSDQQNFSTNSENQDSPIHKLFNKERQTQLIKEYNQQKFNPDGFRQKQLTELKKKLGKNYEKHINTGFSMQVLGLNKGAAKVSSALYQDLHGKGEIAVENEELIKTIESFNYLDLTKKFNQNKITYPVNNNEHFSQHLEEYHAADYCKQLKDNQIIVFNLPLDVDESDVDKVFSQLGQINNIEIKECLTGLPAYATIEFQKQSSVQKARNEWHFKKNFNGKILDIKTNQDFTYESSFNRTLVITGLDNRLSYQDVVSDLSKIGRLMHFEMVQEAENPSLPTKQDVLEYLEDQLFRGEQMEQFLIHDIQAGSGIIQQTRWPNSIADQQVDLESGEARKVGDIIQRLNQERQNRIQQIGEKLISKTNLYSIDWPENLKQQQQTTNTEKNIGKKRPIKPNTQSNYLVKQSNSVTAKVLQQIKERINSTSLSSEDLYEYLTEEEKQEIRTQIIEKKQYINLGYCFCTFASTDQSKMAYLLVNNGICCTLGQSAQAFLKQNTDHYFYDAEHLVERCKQMKIEYDSIMNEIQGQVNSQQATAEQVTQSRSIIQAQEKQNLKEKLLEQAADTQVVKKIENTLESELLSKHQFSFQMKESQESSKLGRNFINTISEEELKEFYSKMQVDVQERQKKAEDYQQREDLFLEAYRNEIRKQGLNDLVNPLKNLAPEARNKLLGNLKDKYEEEMVEELRLKEKENLEQSNWQDKAKQMLRQRARKIAKREYRLQQKVKKLTKKESGEGAEGGEEAAAEAGGEAAAKTEKQDPPKKEAKQEADDTKKKGDGATKGKKNEAYYDPSEMIQQKILNEAEAKKLLQTNIKNKDSELSKSQNEQIIQKQIKSQKYEKFINDLNIMLQGNFQEDLKNTLFKSQDAHECRDSQGNLYLDEQEEDRIIRYLIPADPEQHEKAYQEYLQMKNMFQSLPESFKNKIKNISQTELQNINYLIQKTGIPDGSFKPELAEGQTIEDYVNQLNTFAAEPGEFFQVSKDEFGQPIVIKTLKTYFKADLKDYITPLTDSQINQQMYDAFLQLGFSDEQARKEVFYNEKYGQYSSSVIEKLQEQIKNVNLTEEGIQKICQENNMTYNELQSILKFDFNKHGEEIQQDLEIQLSLEQQKTLFGEVKKEDLIKYETVKLKDEKGKYVVSKFKQH